VIMTKYAILLIILFNLVSCAKDGAQGPKGSTGPQGPKGDTGEQGTPGDNGVGCEVTTVAPNSAAPNGGSLIICANSSALVLNGSNGANGTDGTVILSKPLCNGTTTYPSVFIEVAFCINNTLYAVYSANNGFMTSLPPGNYSSNAIGSSCNFTVGAGCVIGH
jgi:hypothetical protein